MPTQKEFRVGVQIVMVAIAIGFVITVLLYQFNVIETDSESLNSFGFFSLIWGIAIVAAWRHKD